MQGKNLKIKFSASFLLIQLVLYAACEGKIIYVDIGAPGANDGTSWTNAFWCLQNALGQASTGDEIRAAKGIYRPDRRLEISARSRTRTKASGDRSATFQLLSGVRITGGYAGFGEAVPDTRDTGLYKSILSGDLEGNDVNSPDDPVGKDSRAENSYHVLTGSGTDETIVLDGFTITGGNADLYTNRNGGGMLNEYGSPQIINCIFIDNSAQYSGGGIYNYYGSPTLVDCTFTRNVAGTEGGGIYNYLSDPNLNNCTFSHNSAVNGGGIYNSNSSNSGPVFTNCAFRRNSALDYGGGIYNFYSESILRNCIFSGNQARQYGAGISCNGSEPILINCTFSSNSSPNGSSLACNSRGTWSTVVIINCIFWGGGEEIWKNDHSIIEISFSNIIYGRQKSVSNIDADPLFADPNGPDNIPGTEDDDLRLTPLSPCIDMGSSQYLTWPNETDFEGNPRVVGGRADMGAYEFPGIIYVDNYGLDEPWQIDRIEDGSEAHPFHTIQKAINIAKDRQTILVRPGGAYSKIDFMGKAITVAGTGGAAVIEAWSLGGRAAIQKEDAVTFHTGEGPGSMLKNFIIRKSAMAISLNYGSSPTITNLTIVDNDFGIAAYENSNPDISNCFYWNYTGYLEDRNYLFKGPRSSASGRFRSKLLVSDYFGYGHFRSPDSYGSCEKFAGVSITEGTQLSSAYWSREGIAGSNAPEIKLHAGYTDGHVGTYSASDTLTMKVIWKPERGEPYPDDIGPGRFYLPINALH